MDFSPSSNKPTPTQLEHMTEQERIVWTGITDDERLVLHTPVGYRYTMVLVALTKRILTTYELSVGDRLRMLEAINSFVDNVFTEAALAAIAPASDTEMDMIRECWRADEGATRRGASLDLMASQDVFAHFVKINPTLLASIRLLHKRRPMGAPT